MTHFFFMTAYRSTYPGNEIAIFIVRVCLNFICVNTPCNKEEKHGHFKVFQFEFVDC